MMPTHRESSEEESELDADDSDDWDFPVTEDCKDETKRQIEDDTLLESKLAKDFAGHGSATATRIIMRELMHLEKSQHKGEAEGLEVRLTNESNAYCWTVHMRPPLHTPLAVELHQFAQKHGGPDAVQLEVLFSQAYPVDPPFVRIIRPRFAFHTGHVTVGGSICTELLTPAGWSPAYSIESVLIQLRATILTGNGKLDPHQAHVQYDESEAREAFNRVARQHGWMR